MSGGSSQTQTQNTERSPWAPAGSSIQNNVISPLNQWSQNPMQYTGPQYVGPTGTQQQALGQQQQYLEGRAPGMVDATLQAWQGQLDPMQMLNAPGAMNPLNRYAGEVGRALDENIRPGYALAAAQQGFGGAYNSRRAMQDNRAMETAQRAIADFGGDLFANLYGQGAQLSRAAQAAAPGMLAFGQAPQQGLYALGGTQRAEQQQQQNLENARREFEQMEPYQRAAMMNQQLQPLANIGGTSIMTGTTTQNPSMLGQIAGLGMMGAGLMTGNPFMAMGGMGAGGGMSAGGALNPMSAMTFNPYSPAMAGMQPWT